MNHASNGMNPRVLVVLAGNRTSRCGHHDESVDQDSFSISAAQTNSPVYSDQKFIKIILPVIIGNLYFCCEIEVLHSEKKLLS